jgi:hypothetical protein
MIGDLVAWVRAQSDTTQGFLVVGSLGLSVVVIAVIISILT